MQGFAHIGETLRRLRKELGKTLEQIGAEAKLGRGQLSRIENSRQEATFSTLAKILASQGVSRKEFFRRYDLVEAEAFALRKGRESAAELAGESPTPATGRALELQDLFRQFGTWMRAMSEEAPSTAQGAVEVGDFVFTFKLMPKAQISGSAVAPRNEVAEPETPPTRPRAPRGSRKPRAR